MSDTFASPKDPYYLSTRGVDKISFQKQSAPPLAYTDKGILYEMTDGKLYYNGNEVLNSASTVIASQIAATPAPVVVGSTAPTAGQILTADSSTTASWHTIATSGNVSGPVSSTVNAVSRFADITGKVLKDSPVVVEDSGQLDINGVPAVRIATNITLLGHCATGWAGTADTNPSVCIGTDSGSSLQTVGNGNTLIGYFSGKSTTTGVSNTALGYTALQDNITGTANTALGSQALRNAVGSNNIAVGLSSGMALTGSNNVYIGTFGDTATTESNKIRIGQPTLTDECFILGTSSTTYTGDHTPLFVDGSSKIHTGAAGSQLVLGQASNPGAFEQLLTNNVVTELVPTNAPTYIGTGLAAGANNGRYAYTGGFARMAKITLNANIWTTAASPILIQFIVNVNGAGAFAKTLNLSNSYSDLSMCGIFNLPVGAYISVTLKNTTDGSSVYVQNLYTVVEYGA